MYKTFKIIITCEHGGNAIPLKYRKLFSNNKAVLKTHRGYDPGALEAAIAIVKKIKCPFVFETVSRLLVEQNRSRYRKVVFSEYSSSLSNYEKNKLLEKIYDPYHENVYTNINQALKKIKRIYHFSIHSFTPVLNNKIRNVDIGLLYDPSRDIEKKAAISVSKALKNALPELMVRMNYPYRGTSDGLTTTLRKKYPASCYSGIEIEINQRHYQEKTNIWNTLIRKIPEILSFL